MGSCCPETSREPLYLPLWCSSRGCMKAAWSLGPNPLAGLTTRTRVSSHCYEGSMHPKVGKDGWEGEREVGRVTKCSNLKTKPAKKPKHTKKDVRKMWWASNEVIQDFFWLLKAMDPESSWCVIRKAYIIMNTFELILSCSHFKNHQTMRLFQSRWMHAVLRASCHFKRVVKEITSFYTNICAGWNIKRIKKIQLWSVKTSTSAKRMLRLKRKLLG